MNIFISFHTFGIPAVSILFLCGYLQKEALKYINREIELVERTWSNIVFITVGLYC